MRTRPLAGGPWRARTTAQGRGSAETQSGGTNPAAMREGRLRLLRAEGLGRCPSSAVEKLRNTADLGIPLLPLLSSAPPRRTPEEDGASAVRYCAAMASPSRDTRSEPGPFSNGPTPASGPGQHTELQAPIHGWLCDAFGASCLRLRLQIEEKIVNEKIGKLEEN